MGTEIRIVCELYKTCSAHCSFKYPINLEHSPIRIREMFFWGSKYTCEKLDIPNLRRIDYDFAEKKS